ncbi:MAG: YggS family pyridoxal phosphate-dependent enzyme [Spirochaetaceae bacterium]|jgi:pyridoxal phosphate enzyme (YggS family)|nr:YggS family pyridoxal phosphate-dependent enzyme [Spirochaetaceae bacterium]
MAIMDALARIRERIQAACIRSGREIETVKLMGVSKFQTLERIEAAFDAGIRLFGESRVQEAAQKFIPFKGQHPEAEVHLIGSLQRNKAKAAAALFETIQSVDREALIRELGALTAGRERSLGILLELHTGEETKRGFSDERALCQAAEQVLAYPGLVLRGLMTMAPYTDDRAVIRRSFRALVSAQGALVSRFPESDWSCLSMGMSHDFEIAIEEGSTLLRIGTALFGERTL